MRELNASQPFELLIVGEAWGEEEERQGRPFVGPSGKLLRQMLEEAGIRRFRVTNLVNARPPDNDIGAWIALKKKDITPAHVSLFDKMVLPIVEEGYQSLMREIEEHKPKAILALGNAAMWALTGHWGITKWRGSMLQTQHGLVVPTYHPAAILRQWEWRAIAIQDMRRALLAPAGAPRWNFIVRPSFQQTVCVLEWLINFGPPSVELDLETRNGHIACLGLSWSLGDAICIPFMCLENPQGYWSEEQEAHIVWLLYRLLTHIQVCGQNLLYDFQYIYRYWHFVPRTVHDVMLSQHVAFCALPKSLAFQASMYCDHYVFWKEDRKTLLPELPEEQLWVYNCTDCVRTREVSIAHRENIKTMDLRAQEEFMQQMFWPVLRAMQLGLRVDLEARTRLAAEIQDKTKEIDQFFMDVLGHPLNPRSPKQMAALFYQDLGLPKILNEGRVTCDDEALRRIAMKEPILQPLINAIADRRTLGVFDSTFLQAQPGWDGRMRSSFNLCGTYTYRLSSSKDVFGSGMNLENVPSDKSKSLGKAAARGNFSLPNIRTIFTPDPGYTFFDLDLDRADLHVVVWEAEDELLKTAMRLGVDIHLLNVYTIDRKDPPPLEELVETHPKYWDHRGPRKIAREFAKVFCHATNYLGSARTVAIHVGRTVKEIEAAQAIWFGAHPGIREWHKRVRAQVQQGYVENRFGFRWQIFDRRDSILSEAVAWIPQSTVAITINKIWLNIYQQLPQVQVLLQVHDSLAGQFPTHLNLAPQILKASRIQIPYEDELVIPTGLKLSERSWGDCA